jgi:hypothetical protein
MHKKFIIIACALAALIATWFAAKDLITWDIWDAVAKDRVAYVQKYLDNGGDANLTCTKELAFFSMSDATRSFSLLMEAAHSGSADVAIMLIEHGAAVNARSSFGTTPIQYAARRGHTKVLQVLIDHGARINGADHDQPLVDAILSGNCDAVKVLLNAGARMPKEAMNYAIHAGIPMIELLLDRGMRITQEQIDAAEKRKRPEIAEFLRKHRKHR